MYSIRRFCRLALPCACPLCGLRARGGDLCAGCLRDLIPGAPGAGRCVCCALALSSESALVRASAGAALCDACASPAFQMPGYARAIAVIDYAYPGDMLVSALKERGRLGIAGLLARLIASGVQDQSASLPPLAAIVAVPASAASLRRRGFNPAAEIARGLSVAIGVPLRRRWLTRVRESPVQKGLGRAARRQAPQGIYQARQALPDVWVGLVDDVMTTGSTLHHAALALRLAGARGVVALVAARTPTPLWHNGAHVRRDTGSA